MSDDYYSEYVTSRKPHSRAEGLISRWHERMFTQAIRDLGLTRKVRILEVGAGHGQFASHVTSLGNEYHFVDRSPSVTRHLKSQGFEGVCADLAEAPLFMNNYDLVWLSHVLEHCETPSQAAELIRNAAERCAEEGLIVVISPDASSYKWDFFASDWSHGYPTFRRNVVQLMHETGLTCRKARFHRGGFFNPLMRALYFPLAKLPSFPIDRVMSRKRFERGEGYFYSWKTIIGWRQIYVAAGKAEAFDNSGD